MIVEEELLIYTDGSSKQNPRRGGIGIRFIFPDYTNNTENYLDYSQGSFIGATNQKMELYACIIALEKCLEFENLNKLKKITFVVDSNYIITNISNAKYIWPKRKWMSSDGITPIENSEYWENLTRLMKKFYIPINFEKVKAHLKGKRKDIHNDVLDKLAQKEADNPIKIHFKIINARKKYSSFQAKKDSVEILSTPIDIRIINCTSYKKNKQIFKFKYIVYSVEKNNYKMLDWIYYNKRLFEGHTYKVIMEKRNEIPFICHFSQN